MARGSQGELGSAAVEQVAIAALIAMLLLAVISSIAAEGRVDAGRALAGAIARRIVCGPHLPDGCRHHPLVAAYGWPVARLARALAPAPRARPGRLGLPLVPVDFRSCRRESCAVAAGPHLTASRRRLTEFTQIADLRRSLGWLELTYWLYRPTLGWERIVRRADRAQVTATAHQPVLIEDDPALIPLETLPGRNHYDFPAAERPPWQWNVAGIYSGWSS